MIATGDFSPGGKRNDWHLMLELESFAWSHLVRSFMFSGAVVVIVVVVAIPSIGES